MPKTTIPYLTSLHFLKFLKKIIQAQNFIKHFMLTESQYGFARGKCTTCALIDLKEHVIDQLEKINIFLQLCKTTVKHFIALDPI